MKELKFCELKKVIINRETFPCPFNFACETALCPELSKKIKDKAETISFPSAMKSPQNLIYSERFVEKITPYIEEIRKEIFNSATPPFSNNGEAIAWIEKKAKDPLPARVERNKERLIKHGFERPVLEYLESKVVKVVYAYHPDLNKLSEATNLISKGTGFAKNAITVFALTGIKPVIQRYQVLWNNTYVDLPIGETLNNLNMTIKINAKDLSFKELKDIYSKIQSKLKLVKNKHLNEEHLKLYRKVKQLGFPVKNPVFFWKKIAKELKYNSWRHAKITYRRILKKLEG